MTDDASADTAARAPGGDANDPIGLNSWYIDDMYESYAADPSAVDPSWRAYFEASGVNGNANGNGKETSAAAANGAGAPVRPPTRTPTIVEPAPVAAPPAQIAPAPTPVPGSLAPPRAAVPASPPGPTEDQTLPLRGVAGRIVENMVQSISVPTATSVHPLPAKVLEVNRRMLNEELAQRGGTKVSFTHLIAWAVVKGLGTVRPLNASFVDDVDGKATPGVTRYAHVGLGLAIDVERADGSRSLFVPVIKDADCLEFPGFLAAYEDLVRRARENKLGIEDFSGVHVSITNPGTLGTTQSVPRLMAGQGAIIGVGALDFPVEYQGTDPATLASLGIGKVLTLTSTYDHRIIQGAESGLFLKYVHELLVGKHGFYDEVFAALGVTVEPARWDADRAPVAPQGPVADQDKVLAVRRLVDAYRLHGHLLAQLDPLADGPPPVPAELELSTYGLSVWDLDRHFDVGELGSDVRLGDVLERLRTQYCGHIGVQYVHIPDEAERDYVRALVEEGQPGLDEDDARYVLERLSAAEGFERFLHLRYVGQRRFGLEGAEATIPFLDAVLEDAVTYGTDEVVLGMAHRGRLNVLVNVVGKPFGAVFEEFEGQLDDSAYEGSGDVKYHKGAIGKWVARSGAALPVTLASNPSHLEAVDPVVEGIARAKQDRLHDESPYPVLAVLIHGDAAFTAQGVVAETLNLSQVVAYHVGGTVHLVINNQVGFTTEPAEGRSTRYTTDLAKMIDAPIFHVNGDDPDAVVHVARLAMAYREAFHKDVVVDLVCYRLRGHNEGDEPSYTQPLMYKKIEAHPSVRALYAESLVQRAIMTAEETEQVSTAFAEQLRGVLEGVRAGAPADLETLPTRRVPEVPRLNFATGVDADLLGRIAERVEAVPEGFTVHPKLASQFAQRAELLADGEVEWALGEALAFGSLVLEGTDVRLVGQDTRRGTFSQRHAVLVDYETGESFVPLDCLAEPVGQLAAIECPTRPGTFFVRDSVLSEYAALGFEYGYSVESPDTLVCWEAQFGDFANGAQVTIDNFLAAAQEKWNQISSLVMLLPHGYEGQGAEHSSARLERFLSLCANENLTVAQPTSAAQYFHLLRAQARRTTKRPLIVLTPKFLLRARTARSPIGDFSTGGFAEILDDPGRNDAVEASAVERVVCCSGKVAYEAIARRDQLGAPVAVVRVEQLYPWPEAQLVDVLDRYPNVRELIWLQDEPANMGAWTFVRPRLEALYRDRFSIGAVSRAASGSPATGLHAIHDLEVERLLDHAVGELPHVG